MQITTKVDEAMFAEVESIAINDERNIAQIMRIALREYIERRKAA